MLTQSNSSTSVTAASLVEVPSVLSPPVPISLPVIQLPSSSIVSDNHLESPQVQPRLQIPPPVPFESVVNPGEGTATWQHLVLQPQLSESFDKALLNSNIPHPSSENESGDRKRRRKQQISALTYQLDECPNTDPAAVGGKGGKRRKLTTVERQERKQKKAKKEDTEPKSEKTTKKVTTVSRVCVPSKKQSQKKKTDNKSPTKQSQDNTVNVLQTKISLKKPELVGSSVKFAIFPDLTRNKTAIAPSQVILAAETVIVLGKGTDIYKDTGDENDQNTSALVKKKFETSSLFSTFLSTPHFIPLTSIYNASEPFTRILKFSELEKFASGTEFPKSNSKIYECYGGRPVQQPPESRPAKKGYVPDSIVIKYPILRYFTTKPIVLKFPLLKKIPVEDQGNEIAVLKSKVIEIRRADDRNNIQIKIKQSSISVVASDVNAMNQNNIQPVINTDSGLLPILNRASVLPQQSEAQYRQQQNHTIIHNIPQHLYVPQQNQRFQYVQYRFETATELVYDPSPTQTLLVPQPGYLGNSELVNVHTGKEVVYLTPNPASQSKVVTPQPNIVSEQLQNCILSENISTGSPGHYARNAVACIEGKPRIFRILSPRPTLLSLPSNSSYNCTQPISQIQKNPSITPFPQLLPPRSIVLQQVPPEQQKILQSELVTTLQNQHSEQHQQQTSYQSVVLKAPVQQQYQQQLIQHQYQPPHALQNQSKLHTSEQVTHPPIIQNASHPHVQNQLTSLQHQLPGNKLSDTVGPSVFVNHVNQSQLNTTTNVPLSIIHTHTVPPITQKSNIKTKTSKKGNIGVQSQVQQPLLSPPPPQTTLKLDSQTTPIPTITASSGRTQAPVATSSIVHSAKVSGLPTNSIAAKPQGSNTSHVVASQTQFQPQPTKKVFIVNSGGAVPVATATLTVNEGSSPVLSPNRQRSKPGYVAVCHRCGLSSLNIAKCTRCGFEFPEDTKLIQDQWSVNTNKVVLVNSLKSSASPAISTTLDIPIISKTEGIKERDNKTSKKKIRVVDKPAILTSRVSASTGAVLPGSVGVVQLKIEADGGSTVKFVPNIVPVKTANRTTSGVVKKRAPPRKKQQECITLSSDEEESEPQPSSKSSESLQGTSSLTTNSSTGSLADLANNQTDILNKSEVSSSISDTNEMSKAKNMAEKPGEAGENANFDSEEGFNPDDVFKKIELEKKTPGGKFQYATIECRSIRIGSYKITSVEACLSVTLSELGFAFKFPHSTFRHRQVNVCIPLERIISIQANFNKRLPVLFLRTGPGYAKWIRDALGMIGCPERENSNYYCPVTGSRVQRSITLVATSFADADVGIIRKCYSSVLQEIDYDIANKFLIDVTPSYKQSIDFTPDSPAAPLQTTKISDQNNASTSNVVPSSPQPGTPVISNVRSIAVDAEGTIFSYEGRNAKIPISAKDIGCLGYEEFLNDQIIDFWLAVIQTEVLSEEDRKKTFVFDSFFYSKLTEKKKRGLEDATLSAAERRHARVQKRTKNVDIFAKDYLVIPINENFHWFLAVICFPGLQGYHDYDTLEPLPEYSHINKRKLSQSSTPQNPVKRFKNDSVDGTPNSEETNQDETTPPNSGSIGEKSDGVDKTGNQPNRPNSLQRKSSVQLPVRRVKHPVILIFDSLVSESHSRVSATLREYLKVEHKAKKKFDRIFDKNVMPGLLPKVPQQTNFSDCGLFMLQYIEHLFSHPIHTFDLKEVLKLKTWFPPSIAETEKRKEIFNFIRKRIEEKCPQNVSRIPIVNFEARNSNADDCNTDENQMYSDDPDDFTEDEDDEYMYEEEEDSPDDELFEEMMQKAKSNHSEHRTSQDSEDVDDHNYATANVSTTSTTKKAAVLPMPIPKCDTSNKM